MMRQRQPLTSKRCRNVIAALALFALAFAALFWGTGCASTPGDCMIVATCANQRLLKAGVVSRIGLIHTEAYGEHAITVWQIPQTGEIWIYDGNGSYQCPSAKSFSDTEAIATSILLRNATATTWKWWVTQ
jgi:hypothetical protein